MKLYYVVAQGKYDLFVSATSTEEALALWRAYVLKLAWLAEDEVDQGWSFIYAVPSTAAEPVAHEWNDLDHLQR